jgi:hypothetical protein
MTNSPTMPARSDLEHVLETFGANPRRWPEGMRSGLLRLLAVDDVAQRMLRDAEALDRLIDLAPEISAGRRSALLGRIVDAAERQPRLVSGAGANAGDAREPATASRPSQGGRRWTRWSSRDDVFAGVALAASLAIGIMLGQSQVASPAASLLLGYSDSVEAGSSQMALFEESDTLIDEELL